jgi:hypothetical protein
MGEAMVWVYIPTGISFNGEGKGLGTYINI